MTQAKEFAGAVALRASSALSKVKTRKEVFSIGGMSFQLVGPGRTPEEWLGRAFHSAMASASANDPLYRLLVWDGTSSNSLPPERPWDPAAHEPLGVISSYSNDVISCAFDIHTNSLIVCDFGQHACHTWYPNILALPAWAKASPFRVILSWLCNRQRMQIVHGAAVAIDGRAILLAGTGGSGKSTTALACMLAGFDYLGDDYCAVDPAAGKVHMVYRTAKVPKSSLVLMPVLKSMLDNPDRIDEEKGVIYLEPADMRLAHSAKLTSILLPHVGTRSATSIYPATREEAIKAILPSTIGGLMGGTSVTPRLIMELVRTFPAFHLALGTDLSSVTATVASQLARI